MHYGHIYCFCHNLCDSGLSPLFLLDNPPIIDIVRDNIYCSLRESLLNEGDKGGQYG